MRYSASKNGVTLKLGVGAVQDHWKWRRSIDRIRLSIGRPMYVVPFSSHLTWIIMTFKRSLKGIQLVPFESLGAVSYSPFIVTMALSCISSEIKPDIGRTSWFFHTPLHLTPPSEYWHSVWYRKTRMVGLPDGEKTLKICQPFRLNIGVWQTDRHLATA